MKPLCSLIIILFTTQFIRSQTTLTDTTLRITILDGFKLNKKIVIAEYGKAIMYFNQLDYLKKEVESDTIVITPKYFDEPVMANLLKSGKASVYRRSTNSYAETISHHIEQVGSMYDRVFEFYDGVSFFRYLEMLGPSNIKLNFTNFNWNNPDSADSVRRANIIQVREFAYEEEFANTNDKRTIIIKDYFPLTSGTHYVYSNNNGYGELDSIVSKKTSLNGKDIYYFAECYNRNSLISIGTKMFGRGLYYYQHDSLFSIEADYEQDIQKDELGKGMLMLPSTMTTGDSVVIDLGIEKLILTFLKHEDIQIEQTIYRDCIKMKILESWPETIYVGYIWLQKDVGLIKWMRSTGRIDELVNKF